MMVLILAKVNSYEDQNNEDESSLGPSWAIQWKIIAEGKESSNKLASSTLGGIRNLVRW